MTTEVSVIVLLGVCLLSALLAMRKRVAGTTLIGPCHWAIASAVIFIAWTLGREHTSSLFPQEVLCYLVATSTCLPMVALLGAKKPQNIAWQCIVAGLWVILAIPAVTALIYGHQLHLGGIWSGLLIVLIILPLGNYCVTRYIFSTLLLAVAQILLFIDCGTLHIPEAAQNMFDSLDIFPATAALAITSLAMLIAYFLTTPKRRFKTIQHPLLNVWHEFSQLYGLLWSTRVADRVERLCTQSDLSVQLRQNKLLFTTAEGKHPHDAPSSVIPPQAEKTITHLLQRFVSREWIEGITEWQARQDQRPTTDRGHCD